MSSVPDRLEGGPTTRRVDALTNEVGERIRRLRLANGLGQVEFAGRIGVGSGSVSMLENGRMTLHDELLQSLAKELRCSPAFITRRAPTALITQPLLRAYADAPKRTVDRQLADASLVVEVATALGLRTLPDTLPTFHGDLADEHDIEQFALDVRAAASLEDGDVVGNAIRAAERLGCVVLPMSEELGRHLGMSMRIDATPVLCVSRACEDPGAGQIPGDRQRWTTAHELGHLAMHSHLAPPQTAQEAALFEKQAHAFAGAFLAPGDAMLEELASCGGRVTLQTLASIKSRWGIAIKALVTRFRTLGVIDADHARSLFKQISARGWNKGEPVPVGPEAAVWFSRAIDKRFSDMPRPLETASSHVGLDIAHLQRWTDWTAQQTAGEVVQMAGRSRTRSVVTSASARSVTTLDSRR